MKALRITLLIVGTFGLLSSCQPQHARLTSPKQTNIDDPRSPKSRVLMDHVEPFLQEFPVLVKENTGSPTGDKDIEELWYILVAVEPQSTASACDVARDFATDQGWVFDARDFAPYCGMGKKGEVHLSLMPWLQFADPQHPEFFMVSSIVGAMRSEAEQHDRVEALLVLTFSIQLG